MYIVVIDWYSRYDICVLSYWELKNRKWRSILYDDEKWKCWIESCWAVPCHNGTNHINTWQSNSSRTKNKKRRRKQKWEKNTFVLLTFNRMKNIESSISILFRNLWLFSKASHFSSKHISSFVFYGRWWIYIYTLICVIQFPMTGLFFSFWYLSQWFCWLAGKNFTLLFLYLTMRLYQYEYIYLSIYGCDQKERRE